VISRVLKAIAVTVGVPLMVILLCCIGFVSVFAFAVFFRSWIPWAGGR
jgi:hypothetical protein